MRRKRPNEKARHMQDGGGKGEGERGIGSGLLEEHEEHEEWECEADNAHETAEIDFVKRPCATQFVM